MKAFLILFILVLFTARLSAQSDTTSFKNDLDKVLEDITVDNESSQFYDSIEYLTNNPIKVNFAAEEELLQIPFINFADFKTILRHKREIGGFYNEETFRTKSGLGNETLEKILPFLDFSQTNETNLLDQFGQSIKSLRVEYRSRAIRDLLQDKAYSTGKYLGPDLKVYNRFILSNKNDIHAGIIIEKDAGEKSFTDFTAFHISLRNLGLIQNIIVGDYNIEFGQGVALGSRSTLSKGSETVDALSRNARGIKPYLSTDENMFFRGAAVQALFDNIRFNAFYSNKYLDGTIDSTTQQIKSLVTDGLHRTVTETARKHIVNEKFYGASFNYTFKDIFNFGVLYYNSKFGNDFEKETVLDPSGNTFNYFSASYNVRIGKLYVSGETSYSNKSISTINNASIMIDKDFALVFSYRNYSKDYWSFHSNAFGEKDGTQNERGFYTGIHWHTEYGTFDGYYDQFSFPIAATNFLFPSKGNEFAFYYTVQPFRRSEFRFKYRIKSKEDVAILSEQRELVNSTTENIRGELLYHVMKNVQMRTRIEIANVYPTSTSPAEKGFLIYQEIKFSPFDNFNVSTRVVLFKTDSYNSRVYEYENDLSGVMTTPPLYGDGMRWYFIARYNTPFGFALTLKYAETFKPDITSFGNGDTFVNSNLDNRISVQVDFKM